MSQNTIKIYNNDQFSAICKGLKIADCMKNSDDYQHDAEQTLLQLQTLAVSDSLFCSFCQETFDNVADQRIHYKLEWHRYNLKRKLIGKKPCTKIQFENIQEVINKAETINSTSDDDQELSANSDNENDDDISCSDNETPEQYDKNQQLVLLATKHCQVFLSNEKDDLFSIYRCLLHQKKNRLSDDELIAAVRQWENNSCIAIVLVGGGHFAGAVFDGENVLVHKTFHCYTVRQGQGGSQGSRDNKGNAPKSAGASLRRYNEATQIQHVQTIMSNWEQELLKCHVILYRASGPYNRQILFGGKTPALNKLDPRIRPIPFPTKRATFQEVKRVHDIITAIEINKNFEYCQKPKEILCNLSPKSTVSREHRSKSISPRKSNINRAKSREVTQRPLPCSLSASDTDDNIQQDSPLFSRNQEINLQEDLQEFANSPVPPKVKKKPKKKTKPAKPKPEINEVFVNTKQKIYNSIKFPDVILLSTILNEINECVSSGNLKTNIEDNGFMWTENERFKLLSDSANNEKNTFLHLAAQKEHAEIVSILLNSGSDPCIRNIHGKTPYCMTENATVRNVFKTFRSQNPDKFNYAKSQIPEILSEDLATERAEKRKEIKKAKRIREKIKKQEEAERKFDEDERVRFMHLSDREKRALAAERRILANPPVSSTNLKVLARCFTCGADISGKVPFEYNQNRFCTIDCLKAHRMGNSKILS